MLRCSCAIQELCESINELVFHHILKAERILRVAAEKTFGKLTISGNSTARGKGKRARTPAGASEASISTIFRTVASVFCRAGQISKFWFLKDFLITMLVLPPGVDARGKCNCTRHQENTGNSQVEPRMHSHPEPSPFAAYNSSLSARRTVPQSHRSLLPAQKASICLTTWDADPSPLPPYSNFHCRLYVSHC